MDEFAIVHKAMSIPGATFPKEVRHLYRLALQAPRQTQFVELGTYQGRTLSALAHAAHMRDACVFSIDNYQYDEPGSKPSSLQVVHDNLASLDISLLDSVVLIQADSRQVPGYIHEIGMLFVDSTHTKAHFDAEMEVWLPHMVTGAIVACHDYNSPRWLEMTGAIQSWFDNDNYECLGCERRLIGYRRLV